MHTRGKIVLATLLGLGLVAGAASAAQFSPKARFTLSSLRQNANPEMRIRVSQDKGEEELAKVRLTIPAGFKLALDRRLRNGEKLGEGEITIDAGPRCRGLGPVSGPILVPVNIIERNRTSSERAQGVKAVYVVDLRPVTTIDLLVKGSSSRGYRLEGNIPPNDNTCPPFSFDATLLRRGEDSGAKILINPGDPGRYTLRATFFGVGGSTKTISQTVRIR